MELEKDVEDEELLTPELQPPEMGWWPGACPRTAAGAGCQCKAEGSAATASRMPPSCTEGTRTGLKRAAGLESHSRAQQAPAATFLLKYYSKDCGMSFKRFPYWTAL